MASWISFSFLQRSLNWLRLSWNGRKSQLQTAVSGTYQAIQCSLVMSWLCFLVALRMGPMVIIQGLWYCAKLDGEYSRTARDHFLLQYAITDFGKLPVVTYVFFPHKHFHGLSDVAFQSVWGTGVTGSSSILQIACPTLKHLLSYRFPYGTWIYLLCFSFVHCC